ncbi:hypothetical protein [Calothrix sp. NIES-2100]|uniref:hypothetical protein n=1 Tax=Calothrix sp. NIES-2100 TaxID=1954172 RepID=UPI0030D78235
MSNDKSLRVYAFWEILRVWDAIAFFEVFYKAIALPQQAIALLQQAIAFLRCSARRRRSPS